MSIEFVTAHEATQRAEVRKPLAWPTHTTCNNNCNQGRMCDCTAAVEDAEEFTQFGAFNALPAVAVGLVALAAFVALVLAASGLWL
jgi:hypothetical protein